MDFFDKVGEAITSTSKDVVKKAKDLAETTNLNVQISSQEKIINTAYTEIGKVYYEEHKNETDALYIAQFDTIREASEKIAQLKADLTKIKGIKFCATCGAELCGDAAFCSGCGAKVEEETEEAEVVAEADKAEGEADKTEESQSESQSGNNQ